MVVSSTARPMQALDLALMREYFSQRAHRPEEDLVENMIGVKVTAEIRQSFVDLNNIGFSLSPLRGYELKAECSQKSQFEYKCNDNVP